MTRPDRDPLIARLLGPADPEVSCEECFEQLDAYVESQRAGGDADRLHPGMAAHLQGCPACREDRDSLIAWLDHLDFPR
jgi:hypothetical protein